MSTPPSSRPVRRLPLLVILIIAIAIAGAPAEALITNGKLDLNQVVSTEQTIQIVRDLKLAHPVGYQVMTPDEFARLIAKPAPGEPSDAQVAAESAVGAMLGMFPKGTDLRQAAIETLKTQLLAFYDFHTRKMVVIDGSATAPLETAMAQAGKRDLIGYLILSHELTHALQDQNFSLGDQMARDHGNGDRELALRSVAEGDATLAGWGYALGRMDSGTLTLLEAHLGDATKAFARDGSSGSLALYQYFNFPYTEGLRFIGVAYERGGWAAVDALYRDPPQSTQQIIDPSLYYDHRIPPAQVDVAGFAQLLAGWDVVERDTSGELTLKVIIQRNLGENARELPLARQWAGDRIVLLRDGVRFGAIWLIAFRDAGAAHDFGAAYGRILARISGRATPYQIACRDRSVAVIVGYPARVRNLASAVLDASRVQGVVPLPPSTAGGTGAIRPPSH